MTAPLAPIVDLPTLRALEAQHADAGLMERAGAAAAAVAQRLTGNRGRPIVVLAGPGNNGGDAFVVARLLRTGWFDVQVLFAGTPERLPADAAHAYRAFTAAGGRTTDVLPRGAGLVVDGLLGIGLGRAPEGRIAELVRWANEQAAPILALDVPSGLDAATGAAYLPVVRATHTATFLALKPGLVTLDGPDHCGEVSVHDLGVAAPPDAGQRLTWDALAGALPAALTRRVGNVNKGTFGTLGIVGGARGMAGALVLAGRAAMRTGAGKVWLGFLMAEPPPFDALLPELMLRQSSAVLTANPDALVVGPGLGTGEAALAVVLRALAAAVPLVLDADALNLIAADAALRERVSTRAAPTLATPHPGEAARLLATSVAAVQRDRLAAARALSRTLGATVVLKGAGSILAYPDDRFDVNATGGPALASAGSGDVLSGIVGALLAQGLDARAALRYAVCLHGAAADHLVAAGTGPLGVTASELPDAARTLVNRAGRIAA
ncbi:MAG: NAD(P)H-hydrate dehydratase [Burkholderiales bacterium]|nr:NAD(P)H-hydrate dehydratase [Burkholderiales bacterium]